METTLPCHASKPFSSLSALDLLGDAGLGNSISPFQDSVLVNENIVICRSQSALTSKLVYEGFWRRHTQLEGARCVDIRVVTAAT